MKPALVHCLEVARGYCEAELSPAPPGTPRRGPAPKGERKLRGLELRVRVRGTWPVFPAEMVGGHVSAEEPATVCSPHPRVLHS